MEDGIDGRGTQLELWTLLGSTRVVADAAGTALTPWQAAGASAETPGRVEAQKKGRRSARTALDTAKVPAGKSAGSGTPYAQADGAKGKLRIAAARHGNALVVTRRRD